MDKALVVPLAEADDPDICGGKASSLARMIQSGFTIPGGFVVSTQAFGEMTQGLQQDIYRYFDELSAPFVAVRSSAANEDGRESAWAGQLDTFLNTVRHDLIQNIERCWQSAEAPRAQAYAAQKSVSSGRVAVIVQAMVQSEVSGVAFSEHPVLKDPGKIIIEAGLGLGEAVVSGEITPDSYIVDKHSLQVARRQISRQTKELSKNDSGETVWKGCIEPGGRQKLSDEYITQLAGSVARLETYFGYPVDVEWGLCDEVLYILQCRPITALV